MGREGNVSPPYLDSVPPDTAGFVEKTSCMLRRYDGTWVALEVDECNDAGDDVDDSHGLST